MTSMQIVSGMEILRDRQEEAADILNYLTVDTAGTVRLDCETMIGDNLDDAELKAVENG